MNCEGNDMEQEPNKRKAPLSRRELILRRTLIILAVLAATVMLGMAAFVNYVRPPDLPQKPLPEETGTDEPEVLGDEPLLSAGRKDGTYTFLVCGRDTGGGGNTDTMLLATFDTREGSIRVMSLPRDTMVNVRWRTKKLNSVYNGLGIEGLREHVGWLTGITPDFHVIVEWEAVGELVDAIGGVEFDVPYNMDYDDPAQDLHIHQEKGLRRLSGEDAMQVIRWRKNNKNSPYGYHSGIGDSGRIQLQQDFLMAVARECLQLKNLVNINKFAGVFQENVETDLTFGNLLWFGQQALYLDAETDVAFYTLPANMNVSYNGTAYVLPYPDQVVELVNRCFNPYLRDVKESDLQIMVINQNGSLSVTNGTLTDKSAASPAPTASQSPAIDPGFEENGVTEEPEEEMLPEESLPPEDESEFTAAGGDTAQERSNTQ